MKKRKLAAVVAATVVLLAGCSAQESKVEVTPPANNTENKDGSNSSVDRKNSHSDLEFNEAPGYNVHEDAADIQGSMDRGESYLAIMENAAKSVEEESTMTFSLKVDTASYNNIERYIESGKVPPKDAVRTEELINYFNYDANVRMIDGSPFGIYTEVGTSPFNDNKLMAFVRVKTEEINKEDLPSSNLVFLIDTSGSMDSYDKLPLLQEAFGMLVDTLDEDDRVSIVTYAGTSEVVLDGISGDNKEQILEAINSLMAGGSTAGANGIMTAYELAEKNFMKSGNNRVILATDGDFNVGISNLDDLTELISEKKERGSYLSVLGFGTGNIRDDIMETLSASGNGNYSYINSASTARKVLIEELASNLFTVADDVKAQIEFNQENIKDYRLIGYENRTLNNEDFDDDTVDAGEIGVGTDVVMMFEFELNNADLSSESELFDVRIRYKNPGESESNLVTQMNTAADIQAINSTDFNFACAAAAFGHLLRDSSYLGEMSIERTIAKASENLGEDRGGYREIFLDTLFSYREISK